MLKAKNIQLRLVEESDAEFIISLRTDDNYNKYLSTIDGDIESQRKWIKKYKESENKKEQFYFIIERIDGTPCGTVRIYDLENNSFCWGSWILNQDKTKYSAIESALLVYRYGFGELGFKNSHFEVIKGNEKVVQFHLKMGARIISEDSDNYYFRITENDVKIKEKELQRLLS